MVAPEGADQTVLFERGWGLPPMSLSPMLRIHLLQRRGGYSNLVRLEAVHDAAPLSYFTGLNAFKGVMPAESSTLHFRHLLEKAELDVEIFVEFNGTLSKKGMSAKHGTVVDATSDCDAEFDQEGRQEASPGNTRGEEGQSRAFCSRCGSSPSVAQGVVG